MTISSFARMHLLGSLKRGLPSIPYLRIEIASLEYQAMVESQVRSRFKEHFLNNGRNPEWKMSGGYSPSAQRMFLGKACTLQNIFALLSHELIHHLIVYLDGLMASTGMDLLLVNTDNKKLCEMLFIDGKAVL